jgi:hypothetical protein
MAYFKKMTFDRSSGDLTIEKVKIENGVLLDDGTEVISLIQSTANTTQLFQVSTESTAVGTLYRYQYTADVSIPSGCCTLEAPFGYLDSQTPSADSLAEIAFGKQAEEKTITVNENVAPNSSSSNKDIPVGISDKFACLLASIGEGELDHSEVMPTISVMENRKFYISLIERDTDGTITYYNVLIQNKSNS